MNWSIQVKLSIQRMHVSSVLRKEGGSPEKARHPPFAISLPTSSFPVAAFAEAWKHEVKTMKTCLVLMEMKQLDEGARSQMQKVVPAPLVF